MPVRGHFVRPTGHFVAPMLPINATVNIRTPVLSTTKMRNTAKPDSPPQPISYGSLPPVTTRLSAIHFATASRSVFADVKHADLLTSFSTLRVTVRPPFALVVENYRLLEFVSAYETSKIVKTA